MGNLGWYQVMTTMAKKVGGPSKLIGLLVGFGALLGGGTVAGGVAVKNKVAKKLDEKKKQEAAAIIHTVIKNGQSNEGLIFNVDDQFKVLEVDDDAALIEKLGDSNNPYSVSVDFLKNISDYK